MTTLLELPADRRRIASFDVDPQKGFTPLCPDELPVPGGDEIVDALNAQAALAGIRVGSKDAHSPSAIWIATPEQPQFSPVASANVDIRWNSHCLIGTRGCELLDGLPAETDYDFFVWKGIQPDLHPYGACYHDLANTLSTGVIEYLRQVGVTHIIVGGLALDYCVKTTALQLRAAGFEVIVNRTACRGIADTSIDAALNEMIDAGIAIADLE
jgi:nicotinamidase/pyrazinamidase